jgi:hypothetical protein
MKKHFLTPFAILAAALAADQAAATPVAATPDADPAKNAAVGALPSPNFQIRQGNDLFNFVLKRNGETGVMMADHESHASHASHASHSSHASGY